MIQTSDDVVEMVNKLKEKSMSPYKAIGLVCCNTIVRYHGYEPFAKAMTYNVQGLENQ